MPDPSRTRPSDETHAEEAHDAHVEPGADEIEGPDAPDDAKVDDSVAEHYEEMAEHTGANRQPRRRPPSLTHIAG